MAKCKICGADISDDQEICEKCQQDLKDAEQEEFELNDIDFSEIELPELDGDLFETDLEFKLEDPNNDLENPNIFVHDFVIEEPELSEEEQQRIEEDIANIDLPDLLEDVAEEDTIASVDDDINKMENAVESEPVEDEQETDAIPEISELMEVSASEDTIPVTDEELPAVDMGMMETTEEANTEEITQLDDDLLSILGNETDTMSESSVEEQPSDGLLKDDDIEMLLAGATEAQEENDLMDLLPNEDVANSGEADSGTDLMDGLLDGLGLDDVFETDGTAESNESESDNDMLLDLLEGGQDNDKEPNREIFAELDDMQLMDELPDAEKLNQATEKKPKISIWKRLFGNLKDEKWQKQKEKEEKLEAEKLAKEEAKKAKEAEEENAEGEPKIDPKEAKKAEKQAKKEEKARLKEERKAQKQKMKELAELEDADEGRINRVGATIVFVFFGIIAASIIVGTDMYSYNSSIAEATTYFEKDEYNSAYDALWGLKLKEKDKELYTKIQMVMYLNKEWNSYENYTSIRMYPEALDSLLKGIEKYDVHIEDAKDLEVSSDYKKIRKNILNKLKNEYGITEKEAYKLLEIESQEKYSDKVIQLARES